MSNFESGKFEFFVTAPSAAQSIVITAYVSNHPQGGSSIRFGAEERGTFITADIPEKLQGMNYSKKIGQSLSFYDARLQREDNAYMFLLSQTLTGLGKGLISGSSASDAVWTLFCDLVVANPESTFLEAIIDHEFTEFPPLSTPEGPGDYLRQLRQDILESKTPTV